MGTISAIYSVVLAGRRFIYSNIRKPKKLPARVISIGNLTLGGTGKTPAAIAVAQEAKKRGLTPCILTRGYKGITKGPCFISKGDRPLLNVYEAGDEAFLMAEKLKGIPIVTGRKRYEAGAFAFKELSFQPSALSLQPSLFILDDGFQHWALHRDTDVLLIDATDPFGNGRLFPEGRLREPLNALNRADIIVLTKTDMADEELISRTIQKIKRYNSKAPIYMALYTPTALVNISGETMALDTLKKKKIYAFSGIANPLYFKTLLASIGADIVKFKKFRDHYSYKQQDIEKIKNDSSGLEIVTTEKDLVKLKKLRLTETFSALRIEFSIHKEFYNNLFGGNNAKEH